MWTGLIFGGIAIAWIAFLVPWFVARKDAVDRDELDPMASFGEAVRYVARSSAHTLGEQCDAEVSTPLTRRAARAEVAMMARTAAKRRRRVVVTLLVLALVLGGLAVAGLAPWYAPLGGLVLMGGFLVLARFSVRKLNASLDARLAEIEDDSTEDTISFSIAAGKDVEESTELSIEISAPVEGMTGSLWDPIPVTAPTYVSKPLVPRTVRTIDLSAPEPTAAVSRTPVVAEAPETEVFEGVVADERRADAS